MKRIVLSILFLTIVFISSVLAQKKTSYQLNDAIITDSTSTFFFPIGVESYFGKMAFSGGFTNIVVYNFMTEESKNLFPSDSLSIELYRDNHRNLSISGYPNCFLFKATNAYKSYLNGCNPKVIYACDKKGNNFKKITSENENCVGIDFYEKQGFILLKLQKDVNKDGCFNDKEDVVYYYKRLNVKDLSIGKDIEYKR